MRLLAGVCLLLAWAVYVRGQEEDSLTAKKKIFPGIGPGLKAVRRDAKGRYIVLATPGPGLTAFDGNGKQLFQIPSGTAAGSGSKPVLVFGEDCDVDAEGRIYVADRGSSLVKIFSAEGTLLRSFATPEPLSIAVISGGEIAVATLREPHLVTVFDANGRVVREFGAPEEIAERKELNRFLNTGRLQRDDKDHIYYGFDYLPEPTVRQFDRNGFSRAEVQLATLDVMPKAQAVRKEIERQEKRGDTPSFKRVLSAVGVDPKTGEVWMALGNVLHHFDREGNHRAAYRLYTQEGVRVEPVSMLIEPNKILIGSDPLGVYEFERPGATEQKNETR